MPLTFNIDGVVTTEVTISELGDGTLQFDLAVQGGGDIGDLRALFFDISNGNEDLLDGLSIVSNPVVTGFAAEDDSINNLGRGANVRGSVANASDNFDIGVAFGTPGVGRDDLQEVSFILDHDTTDLTLELFADVDFGLRLTSVGEEGGDRDGSLKLAGHSTDTISDPVPDPDPDPIPNFYQGTAELGLAVNGSLSAGASYNDPDPATNDYWAFYLSAGQVVDIQVNRLEDDFDPALWIVQGIVTDPNAQFGPTIDAGDPGFLNFFDDETAYPGGPNGDPFAEAFVAPADGYYTAIVTNFASGSDTGGDGLFDYSFIVL